MSFFNESFMRAPDTGTTTAPEFSASGLTGATAGTRYVGATVSGAPVSGTFDKGDFVVDQTGNIWVCTVAGTPGTWVEVGGGGGSSGFAQVASTGTSGYALTNSTGTVCSWTTPNDGQLHYAFVVALVDVTVATTGGVINYNWNDASGAHNNEIIAGGLTVGWHGTAGSSNNMAGWSVMLPNTTQAVFQTTAMTAGAATLYAAIYGA